MEAIYDNEESFVADREEHESVRRSRSRPSLLLLGVALLTLFFVTQILQLFPAAEGLQIAKIVVIGTLLLFLSSRQRLASRVRILSVPQLRYVIGLLLLAAITIPFSVWPSKATSYVTDVYIKNIVFVYLLVQVVRESREMRMIAGALVLGSTLIVLSILTGFHHGLGLAADERLAVAGSYDVNDLAMLFVVTLPYAFYLMKSSSTTMRILLIVSILSLLTGIIYTGSRGGFLGLLVVGALLLLRAPREARKTALATLALGATVFVFSAPSAYWDRVRTIFNYEQDYNLNERGGRLAIWQTGLKMIAARPLTGVGISTFPMAHSQFSGTKLWLSPHNTVLQVTAELGLGGLIFFGLIVLSAFGLTRRVRRFAGESGDEFGWAASAVEASFAGFLVCAFFLTHAYSAIFCFLVAMAAALYVCHSSRAKNEEAEEIVYA